MPENRSPHKFFVKPKTSNLKIIIRPKKEWLYGLQNRVSQREIAILLSLGAGMSNEQVAQKFRIKEQTVKNHLSNLGHKLGTSNRLQIFLQALQEGMIGIEVEYLGKDKDKNRQTFLLPDRIPDIVQFSQ